MQYNFRRRGYSVVRERVRGLWRSCCNKQEDHLYCCSPVVLQCGFDGVFREADLCNSGKGLFGSQSDRTMLIDDVVITIELREAGLCHTHIRTSLAGTFFSTHNRSC